MGDKQAVIFRAVAGEQLVGDEVHGGLVAGEQWVTFPGDAAGGAGPPIAV